MDFDYPIVPMDSGNYQHLNLLNIIVADASGLAEHIGGGAELL
jgi:hypothetical protein